MAVALILLPSLLSIAVILLDSYNYQALARPIDSLHGALLSRMLTPDLFIIPAVILIARFWENGPWRTLGFSRMKSADLLLGLSGFLLYINYLYYQDSILHHWIATNFAALSATHPIPHQEIWVLWSVAVGAFFEELATRAYIIERVIVLTGSRAAASVVSICVSLIFHVPGRTFDNLLEVTPIILFMTFLYLWRRNLVPSLTAHFLGNAFSALVLTPSRWMVLWIFDPNRNWIILAAGAAFYLLARSYLANRTISSET